MADNVAWTAGSGTTVATDDVGGVHYQRVKIMLGPDATATADADGTAARGLNVDPRLKVVRTQVSSAGLTTSTTAYSVDDQLGTILDFANTPRASGGSATIQSATLLDKAKVVGAVDLYLFDRSVTLATDNAANAFSDADMMFCLGVISFPAPPVTANNGLSTVPIVGLSVVMNATSLYGALVTRTAHTFFGAATDLVVSLLVVQD